MTQKIITDIDYVLRRGVAEVIVESELREALRSGKKLRLKEGFDPSSPDIHLGHMVALRKAPPVPGVRASDCFNRCGLDCTDRRPQWRLRNPSHAHPGTGAGKC